ncbi:hypothetical protein [Lentzea atacamensis]|uniref:hypothetical protein n=1 Tax=Lentzea atacamensis TaxID=531938 RepID=UPI0011BD99D9|nr:hypothetical protein [Lentzea atacamensis]
MANDLVKDLHPAIMGGAVGVAAGVYRWLLKRADALFELTALRVMLRRNVTNQAKSAFDKHSILALIISR